MERALPSLKDRPILGDIVKLDDGTYDFFSHDVEVDEETGEVIYLEKPIGVTQDTENAHLEYDEKRDVYFVMVDGVIWEEYGNQAADILRRKDGTKVSVELSISDLSFNSKEKYLEINDFYFSGITCLGTNPETNVKIEEGMEGSRLDLTTFDEIDKDEEGGSPVEEKHEELIVEPDDIEEVIVENEPEEIELDEEKKEFQLILNGKTFDYAVSLNDKIGAINELVNTVYSDSDNDWYTCQVYDDYVIMMGVWTGRAYKQSYTSENDSYTLTGDREEVYVNFLTKSEEEQLDEMRSNYETLVQFKNDTEAAALKADKEAVLSDEKYNKIRETTEFKALYSEMDKYTKDELKIRATALLGDYYANFEAKEVPAPGKVGFENNPKRNHKNNPYGSLFNE